MSDIEESHCFFISVNSAPMEEDPSIRRIRELEEALQKERDACEWGAYKQGAGYGPYGTGGDGPRLPACPVCGGVKPSEYALSEFIESAIGHKQNCIWYKPRID